MTSGSSFFLRWIMIQKLSPNIRKKLISCLTGILPIPLQFIFQRFILQACSDQDQENRQADWYNAPERTKEQWETQGLDNHA